jgi:undecaprenyl-diphosphatase
VFTGLAYRHRDLAAALTLGAVWLVMALAASAYDTFPGDVDALVAVQDLLGGWYEPVGDLFNGFLHYYGVRLLWLTTIAVLFWVHRKTDAFLFIAVAAIPPLTSLAKWVVARPRPDGSYGSPEYTEPLSFPSGHTTQAVAFFGLWFALAGSLLPPRLVLPVRVVSVVAILLMGLSRIWAGAHWPSDVLGGVVFASALVFAVLALRPLLERWSTYPQRPRT